MKNKFKAILNCIGITLITLIIVNTISFLIDFKNLNFVGDWSIKWKYGTYFINDVPSGLKLGEPKTYGFLVFIFIVTLVVSLKKGKLKFE